MSVGKVPPRAPQRSSNASKPPAAQSAPSKRRESGEDSGSQPKNSTQPDNLSTLDYLVEYKEIVFALVLGLIGYGAYAYFQPYFAAQEAAKQRPVITADAKNEVAAPPTGMLRESAPSPSNSQVTGVKTTPAGMAPIVPPNSTLSAPLTSSAPATVSTRKVTDSFMPITKPAGSTTAGSPKVYIPVTAGSPANGKPTISSSIPPGTPHKNGSETRVRPGF